MGLGELMFLGLLSGIGWVLIDFPEQGGLIIGGLLLSYTVVLMVDSVIDAIKENTEAVRKSKKQ
jgi:hypothetical protein